jgi:hypothetical protein
MIHGVTDGLRHEVPSLPRHTGAYANRKDLGARREAHDPVLAIRAMAMASNNARHLSTVALRRMVCLAIASESEISALKDLPPQVDVSRTHAGVDNGDDNALASGVRPDNLCSLVRR